MSAEAVGIIEDVAATGSRWPSLTFASGHPEIALDVMVAGGAKRCVTTFGQATWTGH